MFVLRSFLVWCLCYVYVWRVVCVTFISGVVCVTFRSVVQLCSAKPFYSLVDSHENI